MVIGDTVRVVADGTTDAIVTTVVGAAVVTHVWWGERRMAVRQIITQGVKINIKNKHFFHFIQRFMF